MIAPAPLYAPTDLADAAARVDATRRAWEALEYRQVADDEMETLRRRLAEKRAELAELADGITAAGVSARYAVLRLGRAAQIVLGLEERFVWVASFMLGVLAVLLMTPAVLLLRPTGGTGAAIFLFTFFATVALGLMLLLPLSRGGLGRAIDEVRATRRERREQSAELRHEVGALEETLTLLAETRAAELAYETAVAAHREVERALADERTHLRGIDWRPLRGVYFEEFVARLFRALGYEVRPPKATGDQGVDLIAVGKGKRVAVQARGCVEAVDNKAVQEVFAGQAFYGCDECVVVTTSRFTPSAAELAARVGCRLIDGSHVAELVEGQVY